MNAMFSGARTLGRLAHESDAAHERVAAHQTVEGD